jgi:hypothetical protein
MLLLGLFTCIFLAMTCLPTIFSVGLLVNERVNMALAAQNAAFAGTAETNPNSAVVDLVEYESARRATEVLAGNLSTTKGFGPNQGQYRAIVTVHDPMNSGERMLVNESRQLNGDCTPSAAPAPMSGERTGVEWVHDTGNCWTDEIVGAYHRVPGLTVDLEGGVQVCASWMAAVFNEDHEGCAELVRMRVRGYADMATENAATTDPKVKAFNASTDEELQSGIATFSWQVTGAQLEIGTRVTCRLTRQADGATIYDGPCQEPTRMQFANLDAANSYSFRVTIDYQGVNGPVSAFGEASAKIPAGANSLRAYITQAPIGYDQGDVRNGANLDWAFQGSGARSASCWLLQSSAEPSSSFAATPHPQDSGEAFTPAECVARFKDKPAPMTPGKTWYMFTIAVPGQIPDRVKWYTGVPPHSVNVTLRHNIAAVVPERPATAPATFGFSWQDSNFAGLDVNERRQVVDEASTFCSLSRRGLTAEGNGAGDWSPVTGEIYTDCPEASMTDGGAATLTYEAAVDLDTGYEYQFIVRVATKGQAQLTRTHIFKVPESPQIVWNKNESELLTSNGIEWNWTIKGGTFVPDRSSCELRNYATRNDAGKITATGDGQITQLDCPANGSYPLLNPAPNKIYCLVFAPGRTSRGGQFISGFGILYRDDPERKAQEAACP